MNDNMIEVQAYHLPALVRAVYDNSVPAGMGFLHYEEGGLTDEEVANIIDRFKDDHTIAVDMDYVKGRCCKFSIFRRDGKLYFYKDWYDHTPEQAQILIDIVSTPGAA